MLLCSMMRDWTVARSSGWVTGKTEKLFLESCTCVTLGRQPYICSWGGEGRGGGKRERRGGEEGRGGGRRGGEEGRGGGRRERRREKGEERRGGGREKDRRREEGEEDGGGRREMMKKGEEEEGREGDERGRVRRLVVK